MMRSLLKKAGRFLQTEEGVTAVEYAVVMMLIFLVVIATIQTLGQNTSDSIEQSASRIEDAIANSGS